MQKLFLYPVVWPPAPDFLGSASIDALMMEKVVRERLA
ncbi:hypothetical protein AB25_2926 [Escherichia coli 2-005-03_S1_C2]|nr:hypothetical protein SB521682_2990 [Shigella boydii 5216-82]EZK13161.1 hypothetical protein AB53_2881 [Escherichia coli 2-005-03_S1_C3]EZK32021.1 hypothetical protein AB25_2926 [Escherichia coli 2-005-03_S1_C2]EZK42847.1 hypothetical protein AA97_2930 [Escherichia coli 2-005-03_S1_C1]KDA63021.1 hypothetical protein AA99_2974 [Escherichia coli 2-052-05_S1_C1]KDT12126.1 hypothetical protein AB55_2928 [Escherichia coli 2-052-05_S1_C3]KDW19598.1 hypothetical protein AB01_2935 [Escherichia coli